MTPNRIDRTPKAHLLVAAVLALAVGVACAACGTSDSTCSSYQSHFNSVVSTARGTSQACAADADCKVLSPAVKCSGNGSSLEACGVLVNAAGQTKILSDLNAVASDLCGSSCGISSSPLCAAQGTPRCVNGACAFVQ